MSNLLSLPEFKMLVDEGETVVTLNGRFIGRAWRGRGAGWWVCRYLEDPTWLDDETAAKQHLLGIMKMPLPDWAKVIPKRGWEDLYGGPPGMEDTP